MNENRIVRRRHLPHIDVEDKPVFITACLEGSIPATSLKRIREYRDALNQKPRPEIFSEADWELKKHKLVFKFVDSILDGESPIQHLSDDALAEIVQDAFLHFADERYQLFAFVVMPSHHHWLFLPDADWVEKFVASQIGKKKKRCTPRESISHSIQSYTGNHCNQVLGVSGAFWQSETFDHYVRDEDELKQIVYYIEQNPVVAGLVSSADEYRWSSANLRKQLGVEAGAAIPRCACAKVSFKE